MNYKLSKYRIVAFITIVILSMSCFTSTIAEASVSDTLDTNITNLIGYSANEVSELEVLRKDIDKYNTQLQQINDEKKFWDKIFDSYIELDNIEDNVELKDAKSEILSAILAYQVEEIVRGSSSEQEKAMRIAKWISSNIANREPLGLDEYGWYSYRSGLCYARARLFVEMLKYQHIPARVFNMYNFGRVGGGHSCAQAYYNNKWHFFDVTYAGVFIKNGDVLSWDEIKSDPKEAMKNLVIFQETLDRWGNVSDDPVNRGKVDNNERMHVTYSEEIIKNARSYGFFRYDDVKILYPSIDWNNYKDGIIRIGTIDKNFEDVTTEGVSKQLSEQLGVSLGTGTDTFHTTWELKNCIPGREYVINYYLYKSNVSDIKYWAKSEDANIISGLEFTADENLVAGNSMIWEIKFIPNSTSCSIKIGYDFREQQKLLFVDMIEIFDNFTNEIIKNKVFETLSKYEKYVELNKCDNIFSTNSGERLNECIEAINSYQDTSGGFYISDENKDIELWYGDEIGEYLSRYLISN